MKLSYIQIIEQINQKMGLPSKYISSPLAPLLVIPSYFLNISPNIITLVGFLFSLIACFFVAFGDYQSWIMAVILFQLGNVFDIADGALARLKNKSTHFGAYLDFFTDRVKETVLFLSFGYAGYVYTNSPTILILTAIAIASFSLRHFDVFTRNKIYKEQIEKIYNSSQVLQGNKFINSLKYTILLDVGTRLALFSVFLLFKLFYAGLIIFIVWTLLLLFTKSILFLYKSKKIYGEY